MRAAFEGIACHLPRRKGRLVEQANRIEKLKRRKRKRTKGGDEGLQPSPVKQKSVALCGLVYIYGGIGNPKTNSWNTWISEAGMA